MARFAQTSMSAKELIVNHNFSDKLLTYAVCCLFTEMCEKSRKSGSGIKKKQYYAPQIPTCKGLIVLSDPISPKM